MADTTQKQRYWKIFKVKWAFKMRHHGWDLFDAIAISQNVFKLNKADIIA